MLFMIEHYSGGVRMKLLLWPTLFAVLSWPAFAQLSASAITGTVSDSAHAVVPGAMVALRNEATGALRETLSDPAGFFSFPNLLPAVYDLTVTAKGFKTTVQRGLELAVDHGLRLDVQLEVGEVRQTVEVAAEPPLLESESSRMSTAVETKQVTELPLNGRQFRAIDPADTRCTSDCAGAIDSLQGIARCGLLFSGDQRSAESV
jgi:hypothetical protein